MKFFTLVALLGLSTISSMATIVNYDTLGSSLCPTAALCGASTSVTIGAVKVDFSVLATATVDASPTSFGSFGEIVISCVGGGTACASQSIAGLTLNIKVTQSAPSGGTGNIAAGTISGTISGTSSSASISWPVANSTTIGLVTYSVANSPLNLTPPTANAGVTSVQARITVIPEPATYAMLGSALVALGLLRRRKA